MLFDLHTHTTASDGRLRPGELVREAARRGLSALAVTDHDTVAGLEEAGAEARAHGVELIPGIEVSATCGSESLHVLGLFITHAEPWFAEFFAAAHQRRVERIHRMTALLAAQGVHLDPGEILARSTHGTVGRPHVAELLIERGFVSSFSEAFDRYLGHGAPAYVGYERVSTRDAIEVIRRARGVAALAHPGLLGRDELIGQMVGEGLQAIEVYHSDHPPEMAARYLEIATRHRLLPTGGSDFHGIDGAGRAGLGCPELSEEDVERLRQAAG
jgi:predicted metal-dependent phosphoesterase TrpH